MDNNKKLGPREILAGIFRKKVFVFTASFLGIVAAYIGAEFQTPIYEATVKMHIKGISQVVVNFYEGLDSRRLHQTQIEIVKSEPVLRRAIYALNLQNVPRDLEKNYCSPIKRFYIDLTAGDGTDKIGSLLDERQREIKLNRAMDTLLSNLIIETVSGTDIFTITVQDMDPERAIAIANVISRSYTIVDQEQQLVDLQQKYGEYHPTVMQLRANINEATNKLNGQKLNDIEASGTASVKIIEQARSDYKSVGKSKKKIFLIILGIGFCLGVGLAFGFDYIDQTLKTPDDIVNHLNMAVIGSVPKVLIYNRQKLFMDEKPDSVYTQFLDDLADQFYVFLKTQNINSVLLTSMQRGEGKSNIAANIAIRLSKQMSCKTLLIDANFSNPSLHKLFNLSGGAGLMNLIEHYRQAAPRGDIAGNEPGQIQAGPDAEKILDKLRIALEQNIKKVHPNLDVLPAGNLKDFSANLIEETVVQNILEETRAKYNLILIDASNLKGNKYMDKMLFMADGVILVVGEGKNRWRIIQAYIGSLRKKNVSFIGAILNNRTFPIPKIIYNRL